MSLDELKQDDKEYLLHLYRQTNGDVSSQVSMFEIGEALGLDREASSRVAEELIGWEMVEIRTLSGGIGISETAVREIEAADLGGDPNRLAIAALGSDPVIDANARQALEDAEVAIKNEVGEIGLAFESLSELMADLKTIDAQLSSPRPKTAVVRECLISIKEVLANSDRAGSLTAVNALLGD